MGDNQHYLLKLPIPIRKLFDEDINTQNIYGHTILHKYVIYPRHFRKILQKLIDRGTNLEIQSELGRTAFLMAVVHCSKLKIEVLLKNGANLHTKDGYNQNALHYLAQPETDHKYPMPDIPGSLTRLHHIYPIFRSLLEKGVDVNLMNHHRETPLMWAACGNHLKIVKILLKYGANVHLQNENLESCLHLATIPTPMNAKVWDERNANIISELILNGACVNCFDNKSRTPLGCILQSRHRNKVYFTRVFLTAASLTNWRRRIEFFVLENRILGDRPGEVSLIKHVDDCYDEIGRMRNFQLSERFNLCQFALMGVSDSEQRIDYEVSSAVLDILLRETFPLYHDFILFNFNVSFLRLKFMELHLSTRSEGRNISLVPDINSVIASFLEIKDLFNVFKALWSRMTV